MKKFEGLGAPLNSHEMRKVIGGCSSFGICQLRAFENCIGLYREWEARDRCFANANYYCMQGCQEQPY